MRVYDQNLISLSLKLDSKPIKIVALYLITGYLVEADKIITEEEV